MTDIRGFLTDENAVSPVIGVVLMVAVTVILSAAVGAFVLDIGNAVTEAQPQTAIDFQYDPVSGSPDDTLTVTHGGGDRLDPAQITITIGGTEAWHDGSAQNGYLEVSSDWDDDATSGESVVLEEDGDNIDPGMTVQVVWTKGQQSAILASDEI